MHLSSVCATPKLALILSCLNLVYTSQEGCTFVREDPSVFINQCADTSAKQECRCKFTPGALWDPPLVD